MAEFFQHIIDGISVGAIYALIALGYTMVYGVLKLINFAHGDVFMVGAMVGWYAARWTGESRSPSIGGALLITLASMAVCACLGFVIELAFLGGRERLAGREVHALLSYSS